MKAKINEMHHTSSFCLTSGVLEDLAKIVKHYDSGGRRLVSVGATKDIADECLSRFIVRFTEQDDKEIRLVDEQVRVVLSVQIEDRCVIVAEAQHPEGTGS